MLGLLVGVLCGIAVGGVTIATSDDDDDDVRYEARAEIEGPPGSGIVGEARFRQRSDEDQPTPVVEVEVKVRGLPREPRQRAFHVHETGTCEPSYSAAGGHFDAGPAKNTEPDQNHPYHLGDLPELDVRRGVGRLYAETTRFVLEPNHPTTIFDGDGAAVIVHEMEDQGDEGAPGRPGPPGSAGGGRAACGVIEVERRGGDDD